MTIEMKSVPSITVSYARTGNSTKANALGMRPMQERVYEKRGEQYLLIKSPPASGKSRALMFVAIDKLQNQGVKQAIEVEGALLEARQIAGRLQEVAVCLGGGRSRQESRHGRQQDKCSRQNRRPQSRTESHAHGAHRAIG